MPSIHAWGGRAGAIHYLFTTCQLIINGVFHMFIHTFYDKTFHGLGVVFFLLGSIYNKTGTLCKFYTSFLSYCAPISVLGVRLFIALLFLQRSGQCTS